jgi:hypothetical protein
MAQTVCVVVSTSEREQLAAIAADRNRRRKHVERPRIALASADWYSAQRLAQSIGVSRPTVRWQKLGMQVRQAAHCGPKIMPLQAAGCAKTRALPRRRDCPPWRRRRHHLQ